MRVLIIGGNGFIGSHIKDICISEGHNVAVLDPKEETYRPQSRNIQFYKGGLGDPSILKKALSSTDIVVHCASSTIPHTSVIDPVADVDNNLAPFIRLIASLEHHKIRKFVFFSSGGTVYGIARKLPIKEDHPKNPIVSHGIVKLAMENYLVASGRLTNMPILILRLGNAYGIRQNPFGQFGSVNTFLGHLAKNEPLMLWGDGSTIRDYVYVSDIARACLSGINGDTEGVVNIGSGRGYSLIEIIEIIKSVVGIKKINVYKKPGRNFDIPAVILNNSRAKNLLKWGPKVSIEDGIRSTWDWILSLSA